MFDQIVTNFCTIAALKSGCQESFQAFGTQNNISKEIDASEKELVRLATKEVYDDFGKRNVEYTFKTAMIVNSLVTKSVQFESPFKPFADEIKCSANQSEYNCILNWKWVLP